METPLAQWEGHEARGVQAYDISRHPVTTRIAA